MSDLTQSVPKRGKSKSTTDAGPIVLIDRTEPDENTASQGSALESVAPTNTRSTSATLSKRLTQGSIRGELQQRKYAKWREQDPSHQSQAESSITEESGSKGRGVDLPWRYARDRVSKHRVGTHSDGKDHEKQAVEIDVLYENQRGSFFCGIPLFSQNSLLNFDPKPWEKARSKPSAVNITNAQVPDPSWEWAWKTWYVDMFRDVDEEGWEYSFSFQKRFAWHGTHPWFHSFVRRRRWMRKRVKKDLRRHRDLIADLDPQREAHALNADYFTIHTRRRGSPTASIGTGPSQTASLRIRQVEAEQSVSLDDVEDIPALMKYLKGATIDRQKIAAIHHFLHYGGEELHYLAEKIPTLMALLVFQSSRQYVLSMLVNEIDASSSQDRDPSERDGLEDNGKKRRLQNLRNAILAAQEQTRHPEYWSDIRDTVPEGSLHAATNVPQGGTSEWQGLDSGEPSRRQTQDPITPPTSEGTRYTTAKESEDTA